MPDLSQNDMDKLFQEGSERYDFEYQPDAWDKMNDLLDKQERRRRWLWWLLGGLSSIFLIAAISISYILKNKNIDTASLPKADEKIEVNEAPQNKNRDSTPGQNTPTDQVTNNGPELGETSQQGRALPSQKNSAKIQDTDFQSSSTAQPVERENVQRYERTITNVPTSRPDTESGTQDTQNMQLAVDSSEAKKEQSSGMLQTEKSNPEAPEKAAPLLDFPRLPMLTIFAVRENPSVEFPNLSLNDSSGIAPLPRSNSFVLGLLGASEFNSVGQGDYTEMNWKFGLHAEYRFAHRWAIRSGLYYIDMWYDAGEGEYVPEKGFWTDGIPPQSTRGQCDVLEIPLLVSYHFKSYQNNGFFTTAGVASYLILDEHYWYRYYNPPPDAVKYWGTDKDESNWLNIGHLSFGYNRHFSNKWSLQVGPYMHLPLKGVGHGAVEIYSLGVNAVVNFTVK